jgi:hypothetical protein
MKDYSKSAKPGRPKCPPGKMVGKFSNGGAVQSKIPGMLAMLQRPAAPAQAQAQTGKPDFRSMFQDYMRSGNARKNPLGFMGQFMSTMRGRRK